MLKEKIYVIILTIFSGSETTGTSKKLNMVKKYFFSCNLFQKVKLSYILDSLHVK